MSKAKAMERVTASLEPNQYRQLQRIAEQRRPPLSVQYVRRYARLNFLSDIKKKSVPDLIGEK